MFWYFCCTESKQLVPNNLLFFANQTIWKYTSNLYITTHSTVFFCLCRNCLPNTSHLTKLTTLKLQVTTHKGLEKMKTTNSSNGCSASVKKKKNTMDILAMQILHSWNLRSRNHSQISWCEACSCSKERSLYDSVFRKINPPHGPQRLTKEEATWPRLLSLLSL